MGKIPRSLPERKRRSLTPSPSLEWRGGVNTTISKQRGRFLDVKRLPFHGKETPSSKRRGRLFVFSSTVPANEVLPRYTETIIHAYFSKPLFQTELIIILNYEL